MQIASPHPRSCHSAPARRLAWESVPPSPHLRRGSHFTLAPPGYKYKKRTGSRRFFRFFPLYLAFLNTVSGAVMTTRVLSATDPVRNALPPTTECSPITVSPPRMDAPE